MKATSTRNGKCGRNRAQAALAAAVADKAAVVVNDTRDARSIAARARRRRRRRTSAATSASRMRGIGVKDLVDLAGLPALDAAGEGARRLGDRHGIEAAEEGSIAPIDSSNTVGLTALMRKPARQFDRRRARESLDRAIDHAGGGAGDDRIVGQHARNQRDRAASRRTSRAASVRLT